VPIRSYRSAFILLFTVLLVLTTAAVGYNAYRRASAVSLGLSADIIDQMAEKVADRTVAILEAAYGYLEMNALVVPRQGLAADRDQVFRLFWRQLELSPQLLSIFAAEPSGGFLQVRDNPQLVTRYIDRSGPRPREQLVYRDQDYAPIAHIEGGGLFDPRETAWYIGALAAQGSVTWSSVYRFTSVQKPGVTAAKTVFGDDGKPVLVLGVDIALEGLSDFISDQPFAKGAVAMIVDDRDRLVAYPFHLKLRAPSRDHAEEALPMVSELADPALVHAYELLKSSTSGAEGQRTQSSGALQGFEVTRTGGVRYIARIHHFPSHWTEGWKLFVVVPEASLLTAAERLLSESAVISLIILAIALFLVSLLALRLFKPLRKLVKNTELVRQMRLSEVEPVQSNFSEIQSMSAALCGMKQGLETLEKFVPATVFHGLIETGADVRPQAEVRELVLVCGGMARLGGLCRLLPPERISDILTEQLDGLTRVLVRLGATVDDYPGREPAGLLGRAHGARGRCCPRLPGRAPMSPDGGRAGGEGRLLPHRHGPESLRDSFGSLHRRQYWLPALSRLHGRGRQRGADLAAEANQPDLRDPSHRDGPGPSGGRARLLVPLARPAANARRGGAFGSVRAPGRAHPPPGRGDPALQSRLRAWAGGAPCRPIRVRR
jgi:hypothetical protein